MTLYLHTFDANNNVSTTKTRAETNPTNGSYLLVENGTNSPNYININQLDEVMTANIGGAVLPKSEDTEYLYYSYSENISPVLFLKKLADIQHGSIELLTDALKQTQTRYLSINKSIKSMRKLAHNKMID